MPSAKIDPPSPSPTTRERVLQAAERLLGQGLPEFSMRELAAEAGVSFATPSIVLVGLAAHGRQRCVDLPRLHADHVEP